MIKVSHDLELEELLDVRTRVKKREVKYYSPHFNTAITLTEEWYYVKPFFYYRDMFGTLNVLDKEEYTTLNPTDQ